MRYIVDHHTIGRASPSTWPKVLLAVRKHAIRGHPRPAVYRLHYNRLQLLTREERATIRRVYDEAFRP